MEGERETKMVAHAISKSRRQANQILPQNWRSTTITIISVHHHQIIVVLYTISISREVCHYLSFEPKDASRSKTS